MQELPENVQKQQNIVENAGKYQSIDFKTRKTLIEMVSENSFSIYRAAKLLGLNHSTAKAIMRKYRRQGLIFRRKTEDNQSSPSENSVPQFTGSQGSSHIAIKKRKQNDERTLISSAAQETYETCMSPYSYGYFYGVLAINISTQPYLYFTLL